VEDFPWPVIAVIRGYALGGGCELALACDLRLGGESAVLGQPEGGLGIVPAAGGSHRLTRLVGTAVARDLIFTGRLVKAPEALALGLLNRVVPDADLLAEARATIEATLKMAPDAIRAAKRLLNLAAAPSYDLAKAESEEQAVLFASEEKRRRMTAFLERRRP
ncbi:enoyl-CoA hydratase/isomerase family protein, partial [bacterium]|nr:enoyl-CoA hydratase/isomerase family protein [bacterium]